MALATLAFFASFAEARPRPGPPARSAISPRRLC
jgi:hypothetical protein